MSKIIDIQKSIVVDLDWLEKEIAFFTDEDVIEDRMYREGLKHVLSNSAPLSKVCEVVWEKSEENTKGILYNLKSLEEWAKAKQNFLNSKIEISD